MSPVDQVNAVLGASIPEPDLSGSADDWRRRGAELRAAALAAVFAKGLDAPDRELGAVWTRTVEPDAPYVVRVVRFEAIPGYWVPALLYEPTGPVPPGGRAAVVNAGGHHDAGIASGYTQIRSANLARRGVVVLSYEFVGMGELAGDADLDLAVGASLHFNLATHELVGIGAPALMFRVMQRALDTVLAVPAVDPARVVVTGLSGGGWQAVVLAALDERVGGVVPVAGFTSLRARIGCDADVGDLEQVPADLARIVDYQELTAMLAPRPALLAYNTDDDCCFQAERVKPVVFDAVVPVFAAYGAAGRFEFHASSEPGDHNYGPDNRRRLYRFLADHFGVDGPPDDCHHDAELLAEADLRVGLPGDQRSVRGLAVERAATLRRARRASGPAPEELRRRLRAVLRAPDYTAGPMPADGAAMVDVGPWRLPVVGVPGDAGSGVVIVIGDDPPSAAAPPAGGPAYRVELLGTGSMALRAPAVEMLACAGHRLLGIQVAQLLAVADAVRASGRVEVATSGLVGPIVALFAAGLRPDVIGSVRVSGTRLGSLEELITRGVRYREAPSLYCADLLTVIDLDEAIGLLDGVAWSDERGGSSYPR